MMPPLHRMPAFYVTVLLVGTVAGIGTLSARLGTSSPSGTGPEDFVSGFPADFDPTPDPLPARSVEPETRTDPSRGDADDGILRTPEGLRRKVLVRGLDVVPVSAPDSGRPVGERLDYFAIRFVYGTWPEGPDQAPTMLQVGPREGPPEGWVPADAVLEWNTRLMAVPTPRGDRPSLVIYRDRECLGAAMTGRTCPRHDGSCPIEGEEPDESAEVVAEAEASPMLGLPILTSETIPRPDGSPGTIFEVASLVRDEAPPPPPPAEPPPDLVPMLRQVYIAFVIDTTASMQATIDAARQVAEGLIADTQRLSHDITLHLALVEFRDDSPQFGFVTRRVTGFTTPRGFRQALDRIEAARRGDGTVDEAVFDGVAAALDLNWPTGRAGELATQMLVLLGDAPDHDRDLDRAQALADRARDQGITIAAVSLERPGTLSRDEQRRHREQWQTLAEGSFRPRDAASGFSEPIPPIHPTLAEADAEAIAPGLRAIIDDRVEHARNLAALARAEAEGRLVEYVNRQGLTLDQVAPVLVDLHRGDPQPQPRPDPRFQGRKAPSIRRGWIAGHLDDRPMVRLAVLMTRDELDVIIDELTQLQQAAQGTAGDLSELLQIGTAAAAGETAFLAADRGSVTFADHLRRRQGLPPARPDSLLDRTQADLLQADDLYRAALNARLAESLVTLIRRRNASDWNDPQRTVDGMALVPYDPIDF